MRKSYPNLLDYARAMRGSMTAAESRLWEELRGRKYRKWRRQHPIAGYVLDFYCAERQLCIEVDGEIHETERQFERDVKRSMKLHAMGIQVIRFRNEEVLHQLDVVLERIRQALDYPLPPAGEGGARQRAG